MMIFSTRHLENNLLFDFNNISHLGVIFSNDCNQQQCFIYSTASFLSKLRAKKVEKLHNSSFYRNFRKLNTGIGNDYFRIIYYLTLTIFHI
jgi:hypothetical protein